MNYEDITSGRSGLRSQDSFVLCQQYLVKSIPDKNQHQVINWKKLYEIMKTDKQLNTNYQ